MAMSTDIAEFLGAALGLNLLFGVPLLPAGLITGVIAFAILELQTRGYRRFELAITALLGIIFLGFLYEALRIGPSAHGSLRGFLPGLHGTAPLYLAVGIIGATVMPHVIYLHSALTNGRMPCRNDRERRRVLRFERLDVIIALGFAGLINMAMLAVAAKLFHTPASPGSARSAKPTPSSASSSAAPPRSRSRSPCLPPAPPRRASAPTRGRLSCRASSTSASRCCCAAPVDDAAGDRGPGASA